MVMDSGYVEPLSRLGSLNNAQNKELDELRLKDLKAKNYL